MTLRLVASVAFTILGVWQVLQSITYGASMYYLGVLPQGVEAHLLLVPLAANAISGIGLLLLRNRLARVLFAAAPIEPPGHPADLQATLLAVAGLVLVALAIPTALAKESDHFLRQRMARQEPGWESFDFDASQELAVARIRVAAQVVVGIGLFFGGPGLAGIWHQLRSRQPEG